MIEAEKRNQWRKTINQSTEQSVRDSKNSSSSNWMTHPSQAIGSLVETRFHTTWHEGEVIGHDIDAATGDIIWHVQYDDGDAADYDRRQLSSIIIGQDDALSKAATRLRAPGKLIGHRFCAQFKGADFHGTITNHDTDAATGDTIWRVNFDDGDEADYDLCDIDTGMQRANKMQRANTAYSNI
jgi:hypothetical protein